MICLCDKIKFLNGVKYMAEFNSCAGLIKDKEKFDELSKMYEESKDPFQEIIDMQRALQTVLA
jgi:hypothetical protein